MSARILALTLCTLLSGCMLDKGYRGSPEDARVSVVRGHGVFLRSANGIELAKSSSGVVILPGANQIDFVVDPSNFNSRGRDPRVFSINFSAEPDREYVITGRRGDGRVCAWPVEKQNGELDFSKPAGCATLKGGSVTTKIRKTPASPGSNSRALLDRY